MKRMEVGIDELIQYGVIKQLERISSVIFISTVQGTGPNFKDPYSYKVCLKDEHD